MTRFPIIVLDASYAIILAIMNLCSNETMFSTANRMGRWRRSFKAELVEQFERRQQLGAATSSVATATSATHTSWPEGKECYHSRKSNFE